MKKAYAFIWEYDVKPERCDEFIDAYGTMGSWAQWFSRAEGYLGTQLLVDERVAYRFRTIDYFVSKIARDAYVSEHETSYLEMDILWEEATLSERKIDELIMGLPADLKRPE